MEGDGTPDPRRQSRRAVLMLAGLGLATAVVMLAGVSYHRSATHVPWSEMNAALDSFPVPDGYRVIDRRQSGQRCAFSPSCENPKVGFTLEPESGQLDPDCALLRAATTRWDDFELDHPQPEFVGGGCVVSGSVSGFYVQVGLGGGYDDAHPPNLWVGVHY